MIETAILAGLNHVLAQSPWAEKKLAVFAGRHARISMPPWRLGLVVGADGRFVAAAEADANADVEITLPAESPFLLLQGLERILQAARVEGSAEFATELAYVLKNLRWDYEEDLSRVVGDIAAHRIAGGVTALAGWQKQAAGRFTENIAEYLAHEHAPVVGIADHRAFAAEVARLRADIDRAERRLTALAPGHKT